MQVINGDIYRHATKVIIKDLNQIVIDGWVENDVIPWIKKECKIDPQLSIDELSESELKKSKDVLLMGEVIDIYLGLNGLYIQNERK